MNSFIKQLVKEDKVKLVEPSEEVSESYLNKSDKSLLSAKTLLEIENFEDATALTYYSMYYSALAILYKCGIKSKNHTGTIILLNEIFDLDNEKIQQAKKERVDKQYYVDFEATEQEVREGISLAEEFNAIIKGKMDKMKRKEKEEYRKLFKKHYGR